MDVGTANRQCRSTTSIHTITTSVTHNFYVEVENKASAKTLATAHPRYFFGLSLFTFAISSRVTGTRTSRLAADRHSNSDDYPASRSRYNSIPKPTRSSSATDKTTVTPVYTEREFYDSRLSCFPHMGICSISVSFKASDAYVKNRLSKTINLAADKPREPPGTI